MRQGPSPSTPRPRKLRQAAIEALESRTLLSSVAGLEYNYYQGTWTALPNFSTLTPIKSGLTHNADISIRNVDTNYAFTWNGTIDIATAGTYTFYAGSDDGSEIAINGSTVVNNDGIHAYQEKSGSVNLAAGSYSIGIEFFQATTSGQELTVSYQGPGIAKEAIPDSVLTCAAPAVVDVSAYGAVGNGTTDDAAAIQNAVNATPDGGTLEFDAGKTYLLSAGLQVARPINIEGNGATLLLDSSNSQTNNQIFYQSPLASTAYTWTGNINFGQNSFNVPISTNVLLPGDTVFLQLGTDQNDSSQPNFGSLAQVISNTGSVVTLNVAFPTAYQNEESAFNQGSRGNSIQRVTDVIQNVTVQDLNFNYHANTTPDTQIWLTIARNVTFNNLTGTCTIMGNLVDSQNVTVTNCNVTVVKLDSSAGRMITGWQDDNLTITNCTATDASDSPIVFLESWARNTSINNLTIYQNFVGSSQQDVFHFTGDSYGTYANNITIDCVSEVNLVQTGGAQALYNFGTVTINGPTNASGTGALIFAPLTLVSDLIIDGNSSNPGFSLNQADTTTVTHAPITLTSNMSGVQYALCSGVVETMTFTLSSLTGVTSILVTASNGGGSNIMQQDPVAGVPLVLQQFFGSDYPFDDINAPNKVISLYTGTVNPGTTLSWSATYYDQGPTDPVPPTATPIPAQASSWNLSVLGSDPAGESSLTYTWAAVSGSSGAPAPTFSVNGTNAAKNSIATFLQVGTYTLSVTITDPSNQSISPTVNATVTLAVTSAAIATPNPVTAKTTSISVGGNDTAGSSTLTYTWSSVSVPANAPPPIFSVNGTNGAQNTTATFHQAGNYTLTATIADQSGSSTTSTVNVVVNQTTTAMVVQPPKATVAIGNTLQYFVLATDQFRNPIASPAVSWSITGGGSINTAGLFTPNSPGTYTVTALSEGIAASTTVTVTGNAPSIATATEALISNSSTLTIATPPATIATNTTTIPLATNNDDKFFDHKSRVHRHK